MPGKDSTKPVYSQYNRNLGLEYNLASANNLFTGKVMVIKSFSPGKTRWPVCTCSQPAITLDKKWILSWQHEYVGKNYNAEVGYVPRNNYIKINPQAGYLFFPGKGSVLSHGPMVNSSYYFNKDFHQHG